MSTREQPTRLAHARTRSHTFAHARTHWHALAKGLDYEEFRTAIKTFPGASNVNLTQEEYEIITDGPVCVCVCVCVFVCVFVFVCR